VMMLSDSLIDLSANVAEGETRLETLNAQHEKLEMEFRSSLTSLQEQLATSIQQIQKQHEQSETQLHSSLVALTTQLTTQQHRLQELRQAIDASAATQREFLIDEQRIIVEAQRAAISDLEEQFAQSGRDHIAKIERLAADLQELRAVLQKVSRAGPLK